MARWNRGGTHMLGLRMPELLIILLVVVVMFGAKKLPELGDSLGKGIRAFKKAAEHGFDDDPKSTPVAPKAQDKLPHAPAATQPASPEAEKANRSGRGPA